MSAGVVHDNYVPTSTHRGRSRAQYLQELGELRESEDVFDGGEEEFWIQAVRADLPPGSMTVGGRVYVRFDHGQRSLASRWYRSVRQLFLARFDV